MVDRWGVRPWPWVKVSLGWPPLPLRAPRAAAPFRYHSTDPTPWPPMRNDTSVPGITNERGKLPAITVPPGPGPTEGPGCATWSTRRWRGSWVARRSASASAHAVGDGPVAETHTGKDHPSTGTTPA